MKNRKLLVLLALVLAMVMACAFALADATNGTAENVSSGAKKLRVNRGQTVNIVIWGNYDYNLGSKDVDAAFNNEMYNLTTGATYRGSTYTLSGSGTVKVTSGSSWLKVVGNAKSWYFNTATNNTSSKARTGKIVVKDSRGTYATYKITQIPKAEMKKLTFVGSYKISLQAKKLKGINGYAFYQDWWYSEYEDELPTNKYFKLIGTSDTYKATFSKPTRDVFWYYKVAPIKRLGSGRLVYGPMSSNYWYFWYN